MEKQINIKEEFPLISFIMPVYNDGNSVRKAITSILDQDWPSIEVIAVNDGSTDNSKEVLDKLSKKHKNLTVLHFEKNKGACVARNEGAKIARSHNAKYYAWLPADAKLFPGMARVWVEGLERFPDCDFLYGGYRFVLDTGETYMDYMSDAFDPYMLEVSNYIDGSFPIKAETFWRVAKELGQDGLWDPNIKSLQDWDFWLSVVKHGGKGFYYKDIFFETTIPHAGGLSDDSHRNWLARTKQIKLKHGIPNRKICVTAPGAPFFGKYIAKLLDADYKDQPQLKAHEYDMIYLLGFYPSIMEHCANVFVDPKDFPNMAQVIKDRNRDIKLTAAHKVVHLIGTDILQMQSMSKMSLEVVKHFLNVKYNAILTEFEPTKKEADELGIINTIVPLPPRKFFEPTPLPKKFTVAVYAPAVNQALYSLDLMEKVAAKLPKVQFKFFGGDHIGKKDNIDYVGYVKDMEGFIKDCSCLMRMTVHDGLPQAVIEFLSAGRRVIFNHQFKHINYEKRLTVDAIVRAIKAESEKGLNLEAAKWIREEFSHEKFIKTIKGMVDYDPKKFWDDNAERWILGTKVYNTKDWEQIEPYVKKLNPESVIDIGCGNGQWSECFDTKEYVGVDISEKLIKAAKEAYPTKNFIASSLEDLKLNKKYDLAFCYTVFEHITEDNMEKAVNALKKVAKKAIIVEPPDIESRNYCHDHDYRKWFKILKTEELGPRRMMLVDLSA